MRGIVFNDVDQDCEASNATYLSTSSTIHVLPKYFSTWLSSLIFVEEKVQYWTTEREMIVLFVEKLEKVSYSCVRWKQSNVHRRSAAHFFVCKSSLVWKSWTWIFPIEKKCCLNNRRYKQIVFLVLVSDLICDRSWPWAHDTQGVPLLISHISNRRDSL